jgi:hypothetical protein
MAGMYLLHQCPGYLFLFLDFARRCQQYLMAMEAAMEGTITAADPGMMNAGTGITEEVTAVDITGKIGK